MDLNHFCVRYKRSEDEVAGSVAQKREFRVEEVDDYEEAEDEEEDDMISLMEKDGEDEILFGKNFHISLFGEIVQDDDDEGEKAEEGGSHEGGGDEDEAMVPVRVGDHGLGNGSSPFSSILEEQKGIYRNVTELLFHPANFHAPIPAVAPAIPYLAGGGGGEGNSSELVSMVDADGHAMEMPLDGEHFDEMMFNIHRLTILKAASWVVRLH